MRLILIFTLLVMTGCAVENGDLERFTVRRDVCDHFRGEDAYDAARGQEIETAVIQNCTGTDAQLAALKVKYVHDPKTMARLSAYESPVE